MSNNIKVGDRITIKREVTGEVTYVGTEAKYFEIKDDATGYGEGFYTSTSGLKFEVHKPAAIDAFKALNPGDKFKLSGPGVYNSDSIRVKISDEMYYNSNSQKTIKVSRGNILNGDNVTLEVVL